MNLLCFIIFCDLSEKSQPTGVCKKNLLVSSNIHISVYSAKIVWFLTLVSMQFIQGKNYYQIYFTTGDERITGNNVIRFIDAFVK